MTKRSSAAGLAFSVLIVAGWGASWGASSSASVITESAGPPLALAAPDTVCAADVCSAVADTTTWPALGEIPWADEDDAIELFNQLLEAGVPLDDAERAQLGLPVAAEHAATDPVGATGDGRAVGPGKRASLRLIEQTWLKLPGEQEPDASDRAAAGRLDFAAGGLAARLRGRFRDGQDACCQATLVFADNGWRLGAGQLGLAHGAGLLAARPGVWTGLAAATPLFAVPEPAFHPAIGPVGSLAGAAVTGSWAQWRVTLIAGELRQVSGSTAAERQHVAQVSHPVRGVRISALAAAWGDGAAGLSVTLAHQRAVAERGERAGAVRLMALLETAVWRSDGLQTWRGAAFGGFSLRSRRLGAEVAGAFADAGAGPPLGQRPACLPGWNGHGWSARADWRATSDVRLQVLWARGQSRLLTRRLPETRVRDRVEIGARWRAAAATWLWLRASSRDDEDRGWGQEHSPWLAPVVLERNPRAQFAAGVEQTQSALTWRLGVRSLAVSRSAEDARSRGTARRSLVQAEGDWRVPARAWLVRARAVQAWGDDVDLQTAAFPLPGRATLRHWGDWLSEVGVGVEHRRGTWRAYLGVSTRRPVTQGRQSLCEVWQGISVSW